MLREQEVAGSNPVAPTIFYFRTIPYPFHEDRYRTAAVSGPAKVQAVQTKEAPPNLEIPPPPPKRLRTPSPTPAEKSGEPFAETPIPTPRSVFHLPVAWDPTEARRALGSFKVLVGWDDWAEKTGLKECAEQLQKHLGAQATYLNVPPAHGMAPEKVFLEKARQGAFRWILLATHGRQGKERVKGGSFAETLLQEADCPVLVHRGQTDWKQIKKILIPFQHFKSLQTALPLALLLAHAFSANIYLYHVMAQQEEAPRFEADLNKNFPGKFIDIKNISLIPGQGSVAQGIADFANHEKFDLVVMANHREKLATPLLPEGVTPEVLRRIDGSLLAIPGGPGENSPG